MTVTPWNPGSPNRSDAGYRFDFCGGDLAIDFTNTVGGRGAELDEHFCTFGDVVSWAEARGVVGQDQADGLRRRAAGDLVWATDEFEAAIEIREALYRVLAARAEGRGAADRDLARINQDLPAALGRLELAEGPDTFVLRTRADQDVRLKDITERVVLAAVDLMATDRVTIVRTCANQECGWLFLDTTRNRGRRWCDMKICGNRAKVRRFRGRGDLKLTR